MGSVEVAEAGDVGSVGAAFIFPSKPQRHFLSHGLETDLFSHALGDHGGDFFGAKRIVAESGEEGSRERWSGTRLRLPSTTAAVSWSVTFLAAGFIV
jgi:hypothetical protein